MMDTQTIKFLTKQFIQIKKLSFVLIFLWTSGFVLGLIGIGLNLGWFEDDIIRLISYVFMIFGGVCWIIFWLIQIVLLTKILPIEQNYKQYKVISTLLFVGIMLFLPLGLVASFMAHKEAIEVLEKTLPEEIYLDETLNPDLHNQNFDT